jgi:hypothetical protein
MRALLQHAIPTASLHHPGVVGVRARPNDAGRALGII